MKQTNTHPSTSNCKECGHPLPHITCEICGKEIHYNQSRHNYMHERCELERERQRLIARGEEPPKLSPRGTNLDDVLRQIRRIPMRGRRI